MGKRSPNKEKARQIRRPCDIPVDETPTLKERNHAALLRRLKKEDEEERRLRTEKAKGKKKKNTKKIPVVVPRHDALERLPRPGQHFQKRSREVFEADHAGTSSAEQTPASHATVPFTPRQVSTPTVPAIPPTSQYASNRWQRLAPAASAPMEPLPATSTTQPSVSINWNALKNAHSPADEDNLMDRDAVPCEASDTVPPASLKSQAVSADKEAALVSNDAVQDYGAHGLHEDSHYENGGSDVAPLSNNVTSGSYGAHTHAAEDRIILRIPNPRSGRKDVARTLSPDSLSADKFVTERELAVERSAGHPAPPAEEASETADWAVESAEDVESAMALLKLSTSEDRGKSVEKAKTHEQPASELAANNNSKYTSVKATIASTPEQSETHATGDKTSAEGVSNIINKDRSVSSPLSLPEPEPLTPTVTLLTWLPGEDASTAVAHQVYAAGDTLMLSAPLDADKITNSTPTSASAAAEQPAAVQAGVKRKNPPSEPSGIPWHQDKKTRTSYKLFNQVVGLSLKNASAKDKATIAAWEREYKGLFDS